VWSSDEGSMIRRAALLVRLDMSISGRGKIA
jgi:hypothetical protein